MSPNVIIIVCDTLRRDAVSVYNKAAKTPFLSKFAKEAVVYDNAVAPASWTFPSHVSLFTGMYQNRHRTHESRTDKLPQIIDLHNGLKAETLPEYMRSLGYNTVGISNNIGVSRFTGFDRGFDTFFNLETSPWWQGE
ncbi:MAG TPA: sulfatase-like hydrolase/transferase, partial [Candidatus Baltobacteraceae bacterium]|nr:sulfatase-like hydrolase/transferase [Candidatus Baltobacteraceae bacterium]